MERSNQNSCASIWHPCLVDVVRHSTGNTHFYHANLPANCWVRRVLTWRPLVQRAVFTGDSFFCQDKNLGSWLIFAANASGWASARNDFIHFCCCNGRWCPMEKGECVYTWFVSHAGALNGLFPDMRGKNHSQSQIQAGFGLNTLDGSMRTLVATQVATSESHGLTWHRHAGDLMFDCLLLIADVYWETCCDWWLLEMDELARIGSDTAKERWRHWKMKIKRRLSMDEAEANPNDNCHVPQIFETNLTQKNVDIPANKGFESSEGLKWKLKRSFKKKGNLDFRSKERRKKWILWHEVCRTFFFFIFCFLPFASTFQSVAFPQILGGFVGFCKCVMIIVYRKFI